MSRKKLTDSKSGTSVTYDIKDSKASTGSDDSKRRFTAASFRNRRKRRKAERTIARTKVTNVFVIFGRASMMLRNHWEVFGGIFLIFALVNTILVGGFADNAQLNDAKNDLVNGGDSQPGSVSTGLTLFSLLISSGSGVATGVTRAYQTVLIVIISLAVVWALRQLYAGNKIRIRDTFYNSTYPLVQLILVLLMICLQLLPAAFGALLINVLLVSGVIIVGWQQLLVAFFCLALLAWSAYLMCSSLFAAYIVTLPGMTPLEALRSAKKIVQYRRGMVLRKLLFLPALLLLVAALIITPLALWLTPAAAVVFYILSMVVVPIIHAYMYNLYRELIRE